MFLNNGLFTGVIVRFTVILLSFVTINSGRPDPRLHCINISTPFKAEFSRSELFWAEARSAWTSLVGRFSEFSDRIASVAVNSKTSDVTGFKIKSVSSVKFSGSSNEYVWPVKGRVTSRFGMRRHPVSRRRAFHSGLDIGARTGTPVVAPVSGRVVSAGYAGTMGRRIRIQTDSGEFLYFGHLSSISCKTGQRVSQGQKIGKVGSTGRSTGPHLHFAIRKNGRFVNPEAYLPGN